MKRVWLQGILLGFLAVPYFGAAPVCAASNEAIEKDRRVIAGTWRIVSLVANGNEAKSDDLKKLKVVNADDGSWTLFADGKEVGSGTSTLNPDKQPREIDFVSTDQQGQEKKHLGIYSLGKDERKLCFVPADKERPSEFASPQGSQQILVTFVREAAKP